MAWQGQRQHDGSLKYVKSGGDVRQNLTDTHKISAMNFVSTSVLTSTNGGMTYDTEVRKDDVEVTGAAAARGSSKTLYEQLEEQKEAQKLQHDGKIKTMYGDGTAKALDAEEVDFLDEQERIKADRRFAVAQKEREDLAEFATLRAERVRPAKERVRRAPLASESERAQKRKRGLKTTINVRPRVCNPAAAAAVGPVPAAIKPKASAVPCVASLLVDYGSSSEESDDSA
jgi:hypothetical protein